MKKIIFASNNKGKVKEMKNILNDLVFDVLSMGEIGIHDNIIENGETFFENAKIKAEFVARKTGLWTISDDSGLCIQALNGKPGVYSARWAGVSATDEELVKYTLDKMKNISTNERQAWFETSVVLISPKNEVFNFTGRIDGVITKEALGKMRNKLPYDLIFKPNGYNKTFAQMSDIEKNNLSHRGVAFRKIVGFLNKIA